MATRIPLVLCLLVMTPRPSAAQEKCAPRPAPRTSRWVSIPGGSFKMGSSAASDEKPVRQISVQPFDLTRTEVTTAQYKQCVLDGACRAAEWAEADNERNLTTGKDGHYKGFAGKHQPVVGVSFRDARKFCRWARGRLPSEAEWEYAARSGGKAQAYPWGNQAATCARAVMKHGGDGCGRKRTWPVCSKKAGNTAQGLCDMGGNVSEYVQDCSPGSYHEAPKDGTAWTSGSCASRRLRGGSWTQDAQTLRVASRDGYSRGNRGRDVGFRCARPSPGRTGIRWMIIPGGSFMMGSHTGEPTEKPLHKVKFRSFFMTRTEVTLAQYRACIKAGKCTKPKSVNYNNWGKPGRDNHPINGVDWSQARAFCKWVGGRLPSEAEWEYAARSGGKARTYPWGDEPGTCARAVTDEPGTKSPSGETDGCGKDRTWPVCSKTAGNTTQGLCDMAGNVWEWVEDCWHPTYAGAPSDGSAWISNCHGTNRVNRGSSWNYPAKNLRVARRDRNTPAIRSSDLGIRCAK